MAVGGNHAADVGCQRERAEGVRGAGEEEHGAGSGPAWSCRDGRGVHGWKNGMV